MTKCDRILKHCNKCNNKFYDVSKKYTNCSKCERIIWFNNIIEHKINDNIFIKLIHCSKCNYNYNNIHNWSDKEITHCCICRDFYINPNGLFNNVEYHTDHDHIQHEINVNQYTLIRNRFLLNYIQDFKKRYYSYPNGFGYIRSKNHFNNYF